jgi:hypothetical protein
MLNHTLPMKLDRTNYVLWRSHIDSVVFTHEFEDFIDGTSICPEKSVIKLLVLIILRLLVWLLRLQPSKLY